MKQFDGYKKRTLTDTLVLLAGGGNKPISDFIGSLQWDDENRKLQYKSASATTWTDLVAFGSNAMSSTSYLPLTGGTITNGSNFAAINFSRTGVGSGTVGGIDSNGLYFMHQDSAGTSSISMYLKAGSGLNVSGNVTANGFIKFGLDNSNILLAGGGEKSVNDFYNDGLSYSALSDSSLFACGSFGIGGTNVTTNPFPGTYGAYINLSGKILYRPLLFMLYDAKRLWLRSTVWDGTVTSWHELAFIDTKVNSATLADNADTVDNKHASDFAAADHNHDSVYSQIGHTHSYLPLSGGTLYNNTTTHSIDTLNATANSADAWNKDGNALLRLGASNNLMIITLGGAGNERKGLIQVGHSDYGTYAWCTGILHLNKLGGNVYINNNLAWHAGNDGSGSTLDADLLDGKHLSELFTDLSRPSDTNNLSITVGGITKSITLGSRAWDSTAYLPLSGGTMTSNIIMGENYIKWTSNHTSNWNITGHNTGIRLLNTVGASGTGAPSNYSIGLHVMGYYGFLLACKDASNTFVMRTMGHGAESDMKSWVTLLHSSNWSSYITLPTKDSWNYDDRYVTALGTDGDYVTWTKNGTTNNLTVPYATYTYRIAPTLLQNVNSCSENLRMRLYYNLNGNNGYAGSDNSYGFPCGNNANGLLWIPVHSGSYGGQLGISSNSHLYYRYISGGSFPTTTNGGSWNRIAWYSEIPTSMAWSSITSKPDTATRWPKWSEITDKITSKTIWGQTYIDASGNFLDVSGWINNVSGTFEFPTYGNSKGIRVFSNAGSASTGSPSAYCVGLCVSGYYSMHLAAYGGGDSTTLWWKNTEGSWREIIHSGNYTSYCAAASHTHPYLPLTGGTLNRSMHSVHTLDKTNGGDNAWNKPDNALLRLESGNNLMILSIGSPSNERHGIILVGHNSWSSYATVVSNLSLNPLGGSVGIGKTTGINYTLDVNGNVGATNFYTTSDRSKKQNISSFSEHIRKFQLKDTEKWHYGVIAQEVPEMFRDGEEGNMTVNYNSVLSYYIGLLENKIKQLEEKINTLENKQNK